MAVPEAVGDLAREDAQVPLQVGACLQRHWQEWEGIGAGEWVVKTLRYGYVLPFLREPPLSSSPLEFPTYKVGSERFLALDLAVKDLLRKAAIEPVVDSQAGFYARIFLVPKATGGWRPICDLSVLNRFLVVTPFRMETVSSILESMAEGEWMVSLDLKDAYFQVPIHPRSRRYMRFVWQGTIYQFRVLCFGLATAPQVFTKVMAPVSAWAHRLGIPLRRYLDDLLISGPSEASCIENTRALLQLCSRVGIWVNFAKSDLSPSQRKQFLGMVLDTVGALVFPSPDRVSRFQVVARQFLTDKAPPVSLWRSLLGHLASLVRLVPGGRLRMRALQWCLKRNWRAALDPDWWRVAPTHQCQKDLAWWLGLENLLKGSPFVMGPPEQTLFSDASQHGWGAHLGDSLVSGVWSLKEKGLHINQLELLAVFRALQTFQQELAGSVVSVMSDNSTVVAYLRNSGGTHSESLSTLAGEVLRWCESLSISLRPRFIPGRRNAIADVLSRKCVGSEWTLHPVVCEKIFRVWGSPQVDLFATALTRRLPLYVSPLPDQGAWRQDAFSFQWMGLDLYAFPPFALIRRVLVRVRETQCVRVALVAPLWPQADWFLLLLDLLVDSPRELPQWTSLLRQPHRHLYHSHPEVLRLHAWRLSSVSSEREAFRARLLFSCPSQLDSRLPPFTRLSGRSTVVGVSRGVWIHALPLL